MLKGLARPPKREGGAIAIIGWASLWGTELRRWSSLFSGSRSEVSELNLWRVSLL